MVQTDRSPRLRGIIGTDKVMDGPGLGPVGGFAGIPLGSDRDFDLSIAINIACGDAHVVPEAGSNPGIEVLGHDKALPVTIAIPSELRFIGDEDVVLPITIDVSDREAVSNPDFGIERLWFETGFAGTEAGQWGGGEKRDEAVKYHDFGN